MAKMAVSAAKARFSSYFHSISANPLRVVVVGSGPAGFYTVEKLLKAHQEAEVDIIDRLPTPFGLVRSGVAPDHPETKIVVNQFSRVARHDRCSFFGNVSIGSSVSLSELRDLYHVVVLAYGAESDRSLGILGEDLAGIYSAREFVWWYNGHPDCRNLMPDLKATDTAVIIGQGNVALDVARILLKPVTELATTDIASHALNALQGSSIRKVYLVGRRGPVQAACTTKELREILGIKGLNVDVQETDLVKTEADDEELKYSRIKRRVYDLLLTASSSKLLGSRRGQSELNFVFFRKPESFFSSENGGPLVGGVRLEKTSLKYGEFGKSVAVGTGEFEEIKCGMVLKSIGYKSVPVDGLPFDHLHGIVPNIKGRVIRSVYENPADVVDGLYVSGWLKRGPSGIIATNLYCAEETVESIIEDIGGCVGSGGRKAGREGLCRLVDSRGGRAVPFGGWEKVEEEEIRVGILKGKPREKITSLHSLLKVSSHF